MLGLAVVLNRHWGHSSAGRAPALHAGGQEFDPPWLHHQLYRVLRAKVSSEKDLIELMRLRIDSSLTKWKSVTKSRHGITAMKWRNEFE
jgi:hypothetical protein